MFQRFLNNLDLVSEVFHLGDIIDIFLVWLIIYKVLLLIKETRVVQVLSGLGILSLIYIVSIWFELFTLNWLLEILFNNLFVIVVVLFQNEIRKGLAHIGRSPFFLKVSVIEETQIIEDITKAAFQLAKKGCGALIVIEREINLDEFIDGGTNLDAHVSVELMSSIFQLTSPLHDGGLLIREGRICRAGCILPLTKNTSIDKNLGLRHRAGIGLSEETDAVVIIVSEENNNVALSEGGRLQLKLDHSSLRTQLYKLFQLEQSIKEPYGLA